MAAKCAKLFARVIVQQIKGNRQLSTTFLARTPISQQGITAFYSYPEVQERFWKLPLPKNTYVATYIWIDGTGERTRSKMRLFETEPERPEDLPWWNYDGSSTYQAVGSDSDMLLKPVFITPDPLWGHPHKLVLCEVFDGKMKPAGTNHRQKCVDTLKKAASHDPWFGIEQEYTLLAPSGLIYGWPTHGFPPPQGPYYCATGGKYAWGRPISESHFRACLFAGLKASGTNAEVLPGQWEYQVGPCPGITAGDEIWLSRYLLERIAEEFGADVTLDPKPAQGDWNGTGAHCNMSTNETRKEGGVEYMKSLMPRLEKRHMDHIRMYDPRGGKDNERRLTGRHETAPIDKFSWGIAHRGVSIRIPRAVAMKGYGWFEDRRPSGNVDPYQVIDRLVTTVCLEK